jgi:pyruvate dehydrogenase E1 component alpha subunit
MDKAGLIALYRQMQLIRVFEDKTAEMYGKAKIGGFLHLASGQEAICVGALSALNPDDDIVTNYRDHGYALTRGVSPRAVMAELFGRKDGTTGGRGGSMHLADISKHFWGGYAIVGAHLPLAAGLAYASQYQKTGRITLCMMGDGSTNIGTFHATLNWAQLWKLPIIFLVENNHYSMGTPLDVHSSVTDIYRKADGYGMRGLQVDGNDVMEVREVFCELTKSVRAGDGPVLVEAVTYRHYGHSYVDKNTPRPAEEISAWRQRDPIHSFVNEVLFKHKHATAEELAAIDKEIEAVVEDSVKFSDTSPLPDRNTLYNYIYHSPVENMQVDGSLIRPPTLYRNSKH